MNIESMKRRESMNENARKLLSTIVSDIVFPSSLDEIKFSLGFVFLEFFLPFCFAMYFALFSILPVHASLCCAKPCSNIRGKENYLLLLRYNKKLRDMCLVFFTLLSQISRLDFSAFYCLSMILQIYSTYERLWILFIWWMALQFSEVKILNFLSKLLSPHNVVFVGTRTVFKETDMMSFNKIYLT